MLTFFIFLSDSAFVNRGFALLILNDLLFEICSGVLMFVHLAVALLNDNELCLIFGSLWIGFEFLLVVVALRVLKSKLVSSFSSVFHSKSSSVVSSFNKPELSNARCELFSIILSWDCFPHFELLVIDGVLWLGVQLIWSVSIFLYNIDIFVSLQAVQSFMLNVSLFTSYILLCVFLYCIWSWILYFWR